MRDSQPEGAPSADGGTLPLPLVARGKVRELYEVPDALEEGGGQHLLIVASDRVSAFDVVMAEPVPEKGRILTQITAWWLSTHLGDVPHHLVSVRTDEIVRAVPELAGCRTAWEGRATLVRRADPIAVECVVRGYLAGSAWAEYRRSGTLAGEPLPRGLVESGPLPRPLFSPATKARGGHDRNIAFAEARELVGSGLADELRERSQAIYDLGQEAAAEAEIIVADTKFEFGLAEGGEVILIDEVLTPDSSRFWPRELYQEGRGQPSLDKQPLRDFLEGLGAWERRYPPPRLPPEVVSATSQRYRELFERLTGVSIDDFEPPSFAPVPGGGRSGGS